MTDRSTGVTTRLVVETVLHALNNPGSWVICLDHHDTHQADVDIHKQVMRVLHTLHVPFDTRGYSILVFPIQHKEYPPS